jgi:hypothetical protein
MKLPISLKVAFVAVGVCPAAAFYTQPAAWAAAPHKLARAPASKAFVGVSRHAALMAPARTAPALASTAAALAEPEPEKTLGSRRLGKMVGPSFDLKLTPLAIIESNTPTWGFSDTVRHVPPRRDATHTKSAPADSSFFDDFVG